MVKPASLLGIASTVSAVNDSTAGEELRATRSSLVDCMKLDTAGSQFPIHHMFVTVRSPSGPSAHSKQTHPDEVGDGSWCFTKTGHNPVTFYDADGTEIPVSHILLYQ